MWNIFKIINKLEDENKVTNTVKLAVTFDSNFNPQIPLPNKDLS